MLGLGAFQHGMPVFGFKDDTRFLKNLSKDLTPYASRPHQNVHYLKYLYTEMKADVSGNHDKWIGSEEINLSVEWFLCDCESPLLDTIEFINSVMLLHVKNLYNTMMNKVTEIC